MKTLLEICVLKGIRIERVRSLEGGHCAEFLGDDESLTPDPGTILLTPRADTPSLVHEMVHAWQWEKGGFKDFYVPKQYPAHPQVREDYEEEDWPSEDMAWYCEESPPEVLNLWWDWIPPDLYNALQQEFYYLM